MSRVKAFVGIALFVFVSLVIVVIVLAVMLAKKKAKEEDTPELQKNTRDPGNIMNVQV